jgi:hypothetical protein
MKPASRKRLARLSLLHFLDGCPSRPKGRGVATRRSTAGVAVLVAVASFSLPRVARADADLQLTLGMSGGWLRRYPTFAVGGLATSAREIGPGTIKSRSGVGLVGFTSGLDVSVDSRVSLPLFGLGLAWAAGPYDTEVSSYDGSIAKLTPWTTFRADILLPGFGYRGKHRRWMWAAAIRSGVSYLRTDAAVAAGAESVSTPLTAWTFLLQAEVEGCRRLDPTTRLCLQVAPRIYEHQLLDGLMVGVRAEWGR